MNLQNAVIVEDEAVAAQSLERQLQAVAPQIKVAARLQSIEDSVDYFRSQPQPDLVFMDIHLADGSAFDIFPRVDIRCPIIFTTAYDQYALDAFRVNSIDYLLKPISPDDLRHALAKLEQLTAAPQTDLQPLVALLQQQCRHYKRHFLIPFGERLVPLAVDTIAFIYLDSKVSYIYDYEGHRTAYDRPLDAIFDDLDPRLFFRANRQFVVAHKAVRELTAWPIGKLRITLTVPTPEHIIVSRARVADFKAWYTE